MATPKVAARLLNRLRSAAAAFISPDRLCPNCQRIDDAFERRLEPAIDDLVRATDRVLSRHGLWDELPHVDVGVRHYRPVTARLLGLCVVLCAVSALLLHALAH